MDQEKELMTMFKTLSKETKQLIISHVHFSILTENAVKKQIKSRNPDLKIDFEPLCADELKPAVNHG